MFPAPTLSPPALQPFQLAFGGLAFGGIDRTSIYQLKDPLTMDMPDVQAGDVQRALDQGEFAGVDVLPGRDITVSQIVTCGSRVGPLGPSTAQAQALDAAVKALGGVFGPAGATEAPLYVQMPSGTFACLARPRKHNCPLDITRIRAGATIATTLLHATDPRFYAAPSKSATVGLPTSPGGGLAVPTVVPWSLGGGSVGGVLDVYNLGYFEVRPKLVITGPVTNPRIANVLLPGVPQLAFSIYLNPGDVLTVDTDLQSVSLTSAGSSVPAPRRNALIAGSTWWNLPGLVQLAGGHSRILFTSDDTGPVAGTLTVQSADGYLSL